MMAIAMSSSGLLPVIHAVRVVRLNAANLPAGSLAPRMPGTKIKFQYQPPPAPAWTQWPAVITSRRLPLFSALAEHCPSPPGVATYTLPTVRDWLTAAVAKGLLGAAGATLPGAPLGDGRRPGLRLTAASRSR